MTELKVALAGNPNSGKTTLFNALTGTHQRVGNWPGVTVEKKAGRFEHRGSQIDIVDLPGIYSLSAFGDTASIDERIAADFMRSGQPELIINVLDASNLERNLYLTVQLLELGVPMLIALNKVDVAEARGTRIDTDALARGLGCPVVPVSATKNRGVRQLKDAVLELAETGQTPVWTTTFDETVENAVAKVEAALPEKLAKRRWHAVKCLEGDIPEQSGTTTRISEELRKELERETGLDIDTLIASARYNAVADIAAQAVQRADEVSQTLTDRLDRVVLNRVLGIPVFLFVMYLMFMFTINIGGAFIDFFDILAGTIFVDGAANLLDALGAPHWLRVLLADGVGGGLQTVATFVPIIAFLFLFLSFLEDSGYMARAAFVMDRFMRMIGLPGKSFVPLIVGFGCNVPAIMAARTLNSPRDRILTVMMAPFMSCGARLPVYALFAAAFFPTGGQDLVFVLYLLGLVAAVGTGFLLKGTLLPGNPTPFVMELPAYHKPSWRGIGIHTWHRVRDFLSEAGRVIVAMVVVLAFLNSWGSDGTFGNEDSDNSVLSEIGRSLTPAFAPMGIEEDNWPATVGIFTGILAKEAVVGTLNTLYTGLSEGADTAASYSFVGGVTEAFASVGPNLRDAFGMAGDPLGLGIGDVSSAEAAAETQLVSGSVFGTMTSLFDGRIGAFAYLLLILLYMPCVATLGAIWRETNWQWALFAGGWTMALAYGSSVLFYQVATFARHPSQSLFWIGGILAALVLFAMVLRVSGRKERAGAAQGPVTE